jgi:deoxyribose-phosphate aldolase
VSSDANPQGPEAIAAFIDHTLLKPDATEWDIERICAEARQYKFRTVCVNPCWVAFAASQLKDGLTRVCSVAGFPLGANLPRIKRAEAEAALTQGAAEIDVVINIGALKSGQRDTVIEDIRHVAAEVHSASALIKVILETGLLTREEKVLACKLAVDAGVDFVKTSTGFAGSGATVSDVRLVRENVPQVIEVKASGGIRTLQNLADMVDAGASRIGTSSGVQIMDELIGKSAPRVAIPLSGARVPGGSDPGSY